MAEHIGMVPVTGGYPIIQEIPALQDRVEFINVQWDFIKWPDEQDMEKPPLQVRAFAEFGRNLQGADEALLRQCHGQWTWHSCRDCEEPPTVISGGRLMVGTVFAARFDCLSLYDQYC
jgi:hypothetical protein